MSTKTKAELDAININGTNVGVPGMEAVQQMVIDRFNGEYVSQKEIDAQRPDIGAWYMANRESKDKKIIAKSHELFALCVRHRETVAYKYTGHEAFGGGTEQHATFCFAIFKKEILNIQLI